MRLSLRFVLPLLVALGLVAYAVRPLVDQLTLRWFVRDLDIRAALVANAVEEPLVELATSNARPKIIAQFNRSDETKRSVFGFLVALGALLSLITVVVARLSRRGWVQGTKALLRGEELVRPVGRTFVPGLQPIARDDEQSVLILSQFTGPARGLPEALVVNPCDTDQCAAAPHLALAMPPAHRRDRMRIVTRAGGVVVPLRREGA